VLGLKGEDDRKKQEREKRTCGVGPSNGENGCDECLAVIPIFQHLLGERKMFDRNNLVMDPGSLYPNMKEFRLAMRQYTIEKEFELGVEAMDKMRYRGYCCGGDCPWSINARLDHKGWDVVVVSVLNDVHDCTSSGQRRTSTPTSTWVAYKAILILMSEPDLGAKKLQKRLQEKYNGVVVYDTVWKGKDKAMAALYGTWEENFQQLLNWKATVMEVSPDSVIEFDCHMVGEKMYFRRFFCALGPCTQGFREGCHPYLSVDSTRLNGRWCGQLAAACGLDGQNWMYPVAFGFLDSETQDNWRWFMDNLRKAIRDPPLLVVSSDACKGLENVANVVFPHVEQRECFRHLMKNYVKKYAGAKHMYPAVRAYRKVVHKHHKALVRCNTEICEWLDTYHSLLWYRGNFNPAIKCDYVTDNMAESFNNWMKDIKDLPVYEVANKLREKIIELFHHRCRIGWMFEGKILSPVLRVLKARTKGLCHLSYVKGDNYDAEVTDNSNCHSKFVLRALHKECQCDEWQHTGLLCQHAICLIIAQPFQDVKLEEFVDDYYSVEKFKNYYKRVVVPLGDKSFWLQVDIGVLV
jgi:hypothetical protein